MSMTWFRVVTKGKNLLFVVGDSVDDALGIYRFVPQTTESLSINMYFKLSTLS